MLTRPRMLAFFLILSIGGVIPLALSSHLTLGAAWADDDDGDDDDGDDDDRDDRGGGGIDRTRGDDDRNARPVLRERIPQRTQQRPQRAAPAPARVRPAPPPPLPPDFAADEIVTLGLSTEDLAVLTAQGFTVLEEVPVPGLAALPRRLSIPRGVTLEAARATVRALPTGGDADFNHYYRSEQGFAPDCRDADCPARIMIDWPEITTREGTCGSAMRIGIVDTGINEEHTTFAGADLSVIRLTPEGFDRSRALHGTAVAALLVGDPATRSPGLVPGASVVAVDAFYRRGGDERADSFTLVRSLGLLSEQGVSVINLSLSGPDNTVLAETIDRLVRARDIVVVAAAGNDGPRASPAFPAAYAPVIAVTAVDRNGAIYRRAVQGPHIDIAAPGVNIWTAASVSGARWKTGTSFAAPFVTAAAAMLREARPDLNAEAVSEALRTAARDLGEPGPDPIYGAGLLDIRGVCERGL